MEKSGAGLNLFGTDAGFGSGWTDISMLGSAFGSSATGLDINPITALQNSTVYACVKAISEDIAKLPLKVERRTPDGGWIEDLNHPVVALLRMPNRRQIAFSFKRALAISYLLSGNAYVAIIRAPDGEPVELIHLTPGSVSVSELGDGVLHYHATCPLFIGKRTSNPQEAGQSRTITEDDMIHIRNMSFNNDRYGMSAIALASECIGVGLAAQQHAANTFRNGGSFQTVLVSPQKLNREQTEATSSEWNRRQSGVKNAGQTPLLSGGMDIKNVSMSPEQAQLVEAREQMVTEICRLFRVPGYKIGVKGDASSSTFEQASQAYIDEAIQPLTRPIEEWFENALFFNDERPFYRLRFDFDELERGDLKTRMEAYQIQLNNGLRNRSDICRVEGWPVPPGGEEYRVMVNTGVAGAQGANAGAMTEKPDTDEPVNNNDLQRPDQA